MNYSLDTVYEFDLTGKVQFGDIPLPELYKMLQDGRVASKFLEHMVSIWFPDLELVDQKGYDHVSLTTGRKYDLKGFTNSGASYAPSKMIGAGRKIDEGKMHKHAHTIDYILSDITEFPKVRIVFKSGSELIETYPKGKIPVTDKQVLFNA